MDFSPQWLFIYQRILPQSEPASPDTSRLEQNDHRCARHFQIHLNLLKRKYGTSIPISLNFSIGSNYQLVKKGIDNGLEPHRRETIT